MGSYSSNFSVRLPLRWCYAQWCPVYDYWYMALIAPLELHDMEWQITHLLWPYYFIPSLVPPQYGVLGCSTQLCCKKKEASFSKDLLCNTHITFIYILLMNWKNIRKCAEKIQYSPSSVHDVISLHGLSTKGGGTLGKRCFLSSMYSKCCNIRPTVYMTITKSRCLLQWGGVQNLSGFYCSLLDVTTPTKSNFLF